MRRGSRQEVLQVESVLRSDQEVTSLNPVSADAETSDLLEEELYMFAYFCSFHLENIFNNLNLTNFLFIFWFIHLSNLRKVTLNTLFKSLCCYCGL